MVIDPSKKMNPVNRMMTESKIVFELYESRRRLARPSKQSIYITYVDNNSQMTIVTKALLDAGCVSFVLTDDDLLFDRSGRNTLGYRYSNEHEIITIYILSDHAEFKKMRSIWLKAVEDGALKDISFQDFTDCAKYLYMNGNLILNQAKKGK